MQIIERIEKQEMIPKVFGREGFALQCAKSFSRWTLLRSFAIKISGLTDRIRSEGHQGEKVGTSSMPEETISIITYEEVKPITDPSGKSPDLKIAGLGQRRRSPLEQEPVVERTEEELQPIQWEYLSKHDVPISKIEAELEKLVTQMNRILPRLDSETAEQSQTSPEQTNRNHRFALYEIALHVEINAEGSLSILGTGGKLGGKGGMQLTFKRS